jgi:predicted nucleotidyltransferase
VIVAETQLDAAAEAYVGEVVERIGGVAEVRGAYVLGSGLLGGFDPATSDIDLVVVVARPLTSDEKEEISRLVAELPVPARKLELVVYAAGARPPDYELNFPDGDGESPHWFVVDAAVAQEHARPFAGAEWSDLIAPVPDEGVRGAVEAGLAWAEQNEPDDPNTRANAIRARRYLDDGIWISKAEARKEAER